MCQKHIFFEVKITQPINETQNEFEMKFWSFINLFKFCLVYHFTSTR